MPITEKKQLKQIVEALLMASARPINLKEMKKLLRENGKSPDTELLKTILKDLSDDCDNRGIELTEVASGYRYQTRAEHAPWLTKLWEDKPPRYSKACLETLALISYRQPITRSGIEEVRGVSVSTSTIRTLEERGWIKIVGHKEVPGRPALYATTQDFLDDFNIRSISELPEIESVEEVTAKNPQLMLPVATDALPPATQNSENRSEPNDRTDTPVDRG